MIKYAMPFVSGVTSRAMGHTNPTPGTRTSQQPSTTQPPSKPQQPSTPQTTRTPQQSSTPKPSTSPSLEKIQDAYDPLPELDFQSVMFRGIPEADIPPFYTGVGSYLQEMHTPTPAGVPYRIVDGDVQGYTNSLNRSGLFPERLSSVSTNTTKTVADDMALDSPIYQMDGKDAMNWLWERRGLKLTDEMWDRIRAARQNVTSQLGNLPQSIYSVWSNDGKVNAYSLAFEKNINKNNQYFNVYNPNYFDETYKPNEYSGRTVYDKETALTLLQRYKMFEDTQDHELSHSANPTLHEIGKGDKGWITDENGKRVLKDNMFFRKTNDPLNPYYDDATTTQRVKDYQQLFAGTYLGKPSEYMGAMARAKRYGAQLGFDTTSADPAKARAAMAKTLHYLANHQKPEELTYEQQRLNSWLNTAAKNSMRLKQKQNQKANQKQNQNVGDYIKDAQNPFYNDVLNFMTDATIQGLVRNDTPTNLNNAYLA